MTNEDERYLEAFEVLNQAINNLDDQIITKIIKDLISTASKAGEGSMMLPAVVFKLYKALLDTAPTPLHEAWLIGRMSTMERSFLETHKARMAEFLKVH